MKKAISILKIAVILTLAVVAVICIFSEPYGETDWLINLILYKAIGFAAAFTAIKLTKCWKDEETFKNLKHFCDEE